MSGVNEVWFQLLIQGDKIKKQIQWYKIFSNFSSSDFMASDNFIFIITD